MSLRSCTLVAILVLLTSRYMSQSVILRPDWFPYFREDSRRWRMSGTHNLPHDIPCPAHMTRYQCYRTFLAVWTRLLHSDKRSSHATVNHSHHNVTTVSKSMVKKSNSSVPTWSLLTVLHKAKHVPN